MPEQNRDSHHYTSTAPTWSSSYVWRPLVQILEQNAHLDKRIFEIGCGNGATAHMLASLGYRVTGVDNSRSGIEVANRTRSSAQLFVGDAYDDLAAEYGKFPFVVSLEVIEHCYYPNKIADNIYRLLEDGGIGIISTPYHGYVKNVALAIANRMDQH